MTEDSPQQITPKDLGRYFGSFIFRGPQGPQGRSGAQGAQGSTGPQGSQGLSGEYAGIGAQGPQGEVGSQGPQGLTGSQGLAGAQGPQGTTGSQGPQGSSGVQGNIGLTGAQGAQGSIGPQGAAGAGYAGTSASNHSLTLGSKTFVTQSGMAYQVGTRVRLAATSSPSSFVEGFVSSYTGTSLTVSVQNFNGTPAANFSSWRISVAGELGPQGPIGSQGNQGTTGSQGAQGLTGPQGTQGTTGAQGNTGLQGPQGLQGPTGPQGAQGNTGSQGSQGNTGPQGNVGSTGPQGAQGSQGSQGTQGDQGAAGPQGNVGAGYDTSSSTSLELSIGSKSFIIGANKAYSGGDRIVLKSSANTSNLMTGLVTSYNISTGAISANIDAFQGTGSPYSDWLVSLGGAPGPQGSEGVQGPQGAQGNQGDTGAQGATYGGTSTTTEELSVGNHTLTIETGKAYQSGDRIRVAYTSSPFDTFMEGNVDSYTSGTGVLIFNADIVEGNGTYANWIVSLTGVRGAQGLQGAQGSQGAQGTQGVQGVQGSQSAFYGGTSTSSMQIGLGSRVLTTQANRAWTPGSRIRAYSTGSGELVEGTVTAYDAGSGVLDFISDRYFGVLGAHHTDWSLSLIGEQGVQGPQGFQGAQGPQAAQLPLESNAYQRTIESSTVDSNYSNVNGDAEITLTLANTAKIFVQAEFSGNDSGEGGSVRIVVKNNASSTVFTSDEIHFPTFNTNRFSIQGLTGDLPPGDYTVCLELKSNLDGNEASIAKVTLFGQVQLAGRGPQGNQGAQGPQGVQGTQGNTGAQGPQGAQSVEIERIENIEATQEMYNDRLDDIDIALINGYNLQEVTERGGITDVPLILNGSMMPNPDPDISMDPEADLPVTMITIREDSHLEYPGEARISHRALTFDAISPSETITSRIVVQAQAISIYSAQSMAVPEVDQSPDIYILNNGSIGTKAADIGNLVNAAPVWTTGTMKARRDLHAGRNSYHENKTIVGPGRQDSVGGNKGATIFGHDGSELNGWTAGSTVGILDTDDGKIRLRSRNAQDIIELNNRVKIQGRRVESVLATNHSVRTVAANTDDWAEFSFVVPANDHVANATISAEVRGFLENFVLQNNEWVLQVLVGGVTIINNISYHIASDPVGWWANIRIVPTSATAGRVAADFYPHDPFMNNFSIPLSIFGSYSGTSGDVAVLIRVRRNGAPNGSENEYATMDYSVARFISAD